MSEMHVIGIVAAGAALMFVSMIVAIKRCWHPIAQGRALIVNRMQGEPRVSFTGALVLPIVHNAEEIDLGVRKLVVDHHGKGGVVCRDNIRADLKVTFFIRVNRTTEDILAVARSIGCARAADQATLEELFSARFSQAIKSVAKQLDFEQLFTQREELKDKIVEVIGKDLGGHVLDDAAIDELEQTPIEMLDPNNILDAQGIRKILIQSAQVDQVKGESRAAELGPTRESGPLIGQLEQLGLLDIRITTEVACDVGLGRPSLSVRIESSGDMTIAQLPSSVPRAAIGAVGAGELTCSGGRATFRWTQTKVSTGQLIAGAQLVHALRDDEHARH